jgi:hypothetical protein
MAGVTIKLFLPKGDAQSLRTAELVNWTGKALAGPRSQLDELLRREELNKSGVYILLGADPDTGKQAAYIGEAEVVRDRLKQHREKEFWVQAIAFVSKDENLTKSHIRYLEGRLIDEAHQVGRFKLLNGQSSGSKLPESDREDMEVFLDRVVQLLPVLGCDLLTPILDVAASSPKLRLTGRIKGAVSHGQRTAKGFVVFTNYQAVTENRPSAQNYVSNILSLREEYQRDGTLVEDGNRLRFTRDVEFSSPSMAAAVICGGHANGLTFWKDNEGRDLKSIESQS